MMRWGGYEPDPKYIYFAGIILGLLIIGIFVSLAVRGEEFLPESLYFISQEDNLLYVFSPTTLQTYPLNGILEEELYQKLTRKSIWKKIGEGFGIAGGVVLTGGNIAALAIPTLSPVIKLGTWITSGILTATGSILRWVTKDRPPQLIPAEMVIIDKDTILSLGSEISVLVSGWHYGLANSSLKRVSGYLLSYSAEKPVGKVPLIEADKEIEIVINPLGVYLRSIPYQAPPVVIVKVSKER